MRWLGQLEPGTTPRRKIDVFDRARRWRQRNRTIGRTTSGRVLVGLVFGRELRSAIPA
jgi:hypothetical protein